MSGWLYTAVGITAYDLYRWHKDKDTMSIAFGKAFRHPVGRIVLPAAWGVLTTHLFLGRPKWWKLPSKMEGGGE